MSPEISPSTCLAAAFVRLVNDGEIHDFFFFSTTESKLKQQSKARAFLMFLFFPAQSWS